MRDRWKHYAKRYQKMKTYATSTGTSLDEEDERKGFKNFGESWTGFAHDAEQDEENVNEKERPEAGRPDNFSTYDPADFEFNFIDREEEASIETDHSTEETQRETDRNAEKENSVNPRAPKNRKVRTLATLAADSQELMRNNMASGFRESSAGKTAERIGMAKLDFEKKKWEATNAASTNADKTKLETECMALACALVVDKGMSPKAAQSFLESMKM
ncbi:hypothetical protein BDK51DRAFT_46194 [Blyttiomyces helicus]|uniref:Uncharacterized protein n=1 Tax=Blyttiomyces helicus TaxID=388810 RepID=A0A4V1IR98_9FUNG|nr:hypothetical protein BDK51DRAFT_46194 [Blyttiomyces helicus]|eukprot:RKO89307.1 hypothetical protein BDK51DRAFT_46194 [Blyttiomyces helicus]